MLWKKTNLIPLITKPEKIKTLVITKDGKVYPSTFSMSALSSRYLIKQLQKIINKKELNIITR